VLSFVRAPSRGERPEEPEAILARRFAAGELTADEYNQALDVLHARAPERTRQ
jgi:uncharacterized membrane protein